VLYRGTGATLAAQQGEDIVFEYWAMKERLSIEGANVYRFILK
jgi:hypothetical protein